MSMLKEMYNGPQTIRSIRELIGSLEWELQGNRRTLEEMRYVKQYFGIVDTDKCNVKQLVTSKEYEVTRTIIIHTERFISFLQAILNECDGSKK
jgi:hypothetical protein